MPFPGPVGLGAAALALALAAIVSAAGAPGARADAACDRYASTAGSDANPGTAAAPVRSVARLIRITGPGEDGCLRTGDEFVEPIGTFIADHAGGTPGSPATIRPEDPAGTATVKGALWLKAAAHDITFSRVRFTDSPGNTSKGTMLVVDGDRITFAETEMSYSRGICLTAGARDGYAAGDPPGTAAAEDLVVERSRIHDCGTDPAIAASLRQPGQSGVHGLYLINAPRAVIRDSLIYGNVDRGIQFWPDVDGALVEHNVIDGNGSNVNLGSSAAYGHFSERNTVRDNVISNAVLRSVTDPPWSPGDTEAILGYFPLDGSTHGNVFEGNCVVQSDPARRYGGAGYAHIGDLFPPAGSPLYAGPAGGYFVLARDSLCIGKGPRRPGTPLAAAGESSPPAGPAPPGIPPGGPRPPAPDRRPPRIRLAGSVVQAGGRRILRIRLDERAVLAILLQRRANRRWSTERSLAAARPAGLVSIEIPAIRRRGPPAAWRAVIRASDASGNRSAAVVAALGPH